MDWKLELVAIPVSDVDRAKAFYTEKVGFNADHDQTVSDEIRFVQLTLRGRHARSRSAKDWWTRSLGPCRACRWWSRTSAPPAPSWSSAASRPVKSSSSRGAHSFFSAIRTGTAGRCNRCPRATDPCFDAITSGQTPG